MLKELRCPNCRRLLLRFKIINGIVEEKCGSCNSLVTLTITNTESKVVVEQILSSYFRKQLV